MTPYTQRLKEAIDTIQADFDTGYLNPDGQWATYELLQAATKFRDLDTLHGEEKIASLLAGEAEVVPVTTCLSDIKITTDGKVPPGELRLMYGDKCLGRVINIERDQAMRATSREGEGRE